MNTLNTLIVDDNPLARHALKHLVGQIDYLTLAGECTNPIDAINFLNREKVDLLLLDVEMPEMTGLDRIKIDQQLAAGQLTTAKSDYAVEAFEQKVIDYLIKPIALPRFIKAIERAKEAFEASSSYEAGEFLFCTS
jgi:two-component SAPR family response regulator